MEREKYGGKEKQKKRRLVFFNCQSSFGLELGDAWQGSVVLSSMAGSAGAAGCSSTGSLLPGLFLLVGEISLPF